jgi:hypothetical protein
MDELMVLQGDVSESLRIESGNESVNLFRELNREYVLCRWIVRAPLRIETCHPSVLDTRFLMQQGK